MVETSGSVAVERILGLPPTENASERPAIVTELSTEGQIKLEVLQGLLEPCDRDTYGQRLRAGANKLGISVRTLQRLHKKFQLKGLVALTSTERADRGQYRTTKFWQDFILKTYKDGNKGSRRITPKQVAIHVATKAQEIGDPHPPSYSTVLRIIKPVQKRAELVEGIRSPGNYSPDLQLKTRDGQKLDVSRSNQVWQTDHTVLDIFLVDQYGVPIGRPYLTTIIDSYSRALMGINLGFDAPSAQVAALALRHAILPKSYGPEYGLHTEWIACGKPAYLYTDGGKEFRSNHLIEIGAQLGFIHKLRDRPSSGGTIERFFGTLNQSVLRALPGYTGSNVQERPKDAEKDAQLTLKDLERLIVPFIVDTYNQRPDGRSQDQTRNQRWESGLGCFSQPRLIAENELDLCLMKSMRRTVQKGGHIQFENLMYRGEELASQAGQVVNIRYDPADITRIRIYSQKDNKEVFLAFAYAQDLLTSELSWNEAKASSKRLRTESKKITNKAVAYDVISHAAKIAAEKPDRKQRRKSEQKYKKTPPNTDREAVAQTDAKGADLEQDDPQVLPSFDDIEMLDLGQIRNNHKW